MTSNLGAQQARKGEFGLAAAAKGDSFSHNDGKERMLETLNASWKPELINRLDEEIVFRHLDRLQCAAILKREVNLFIKCAANLGFEIEATPPVYDLLLKKGFDPDYGARPLRRAVEKYLLDPLSESILSGELSKGDLILAIRDGNCVKYIPSGQIPRPALMAG